MVLLGLLALLVAGSATAAHSTPKLVRVVKHDGAFTATLTYTRHGGPWNFTPISNVTLRIERAGHLVLKRRICQPGHFRLPRYRCEWGPGLSLSRGRVGPSNSPAFLVGLWSGGNTCCGVTSIAILGRQVNWIRHEWSWMGAGLSRIRGRGVFVAADGRFYCAFSVCAGGTTPIQIWEINAAQKFIDVTRSFPALIRESAHALATGGGPRQTIRDQGSGVLASWCADEYLLGRGRHCAYVLAYAVKHHRPNMQGAEPTRGFVRALNRDLARWGYKR
jgi:hypothetical protein